MKSTCAKPSEKKIGRNKYFHDTFQEFFHEYFS